MTWLLEKLGVFFDWILGSRTTEEYTGVVANRTVTLRSDTDDKVAIVAEITQITFITRYRRWKFLEKTDRVYRVKLEAPDRIREKLDARLFEPMTFPLLCNSLLRGTGYPHTHALLAFLHHVSPIAPSIKCEL